MAVQTDRCTTIYKKDAAQSSSSSSSSSSEDKAISDATCEASCLCKALTMGFVNPRAAAHSDSEVTKFALDKAIQVSHPFTREQFDGQNPVDGVCMALLSAPSEAISQTMGNTKALAKDPKLLGPKAECLDQCFRMSAFLQQNPNST